jgi:hypothetical protein
VSRSHFLKRTVSASLFLWVVVLSAAVPSAVVLVAGPVHANTQAIQAEAFAAPETQPARPPITGATSDERDRRVFATLIVTVIGTIGLITIGSVVLLTQPGDRQVMVVTDPADPSEPSAAPSTSGVDRDGTKPAAERHLSE